MWFVGSALSTGQARQLQALQSIDEKLGKLDDLKDAVWAVEQEASWFHQRFRVPTQEELDDAKFSHDTFAHHST